MILTRASKHEYLLVEPISKTPYPPLGLLKISSMLRDRNKDCRIFVQIGKGKPKGLNSPKKIFITSLFTWDWKPLIDTINFYKWSFPNSEIIVGGISASLLSKEIYSYTKIKPHVGLYNDAESYPPDYSLAFGRVNRLSITSTTRGCINACRYCSVKELEPDFYVKDNWENDIVEEFPRVLFWDNNFLASPNFDKDCTKLSKIKKKVDFNQGLDSRLLNEERAKRLFKIDLDPIRFAFDDIGYEKDILRAIQLAKKYSTREIIVYVLYNFMDTPEDLYYRINLLNRQGVLSFPMEYRAPTMFINKLPGIYWDTFLLRAFKLSLMFYYRKGMITLSRTSFRSIYGRNEREFVLKLYEIFEYDKSRKVKRKCSSSGDYKNV
jgi:hypothetical protein